MPNGQVVKPALFNQKLLVLPHCVMILLIGLGLKKSQASKSYDLLVTCHPTFIFPNLTIEGKYLQTNHYSQLQNRINGAYMVKTCDISAK